MAEYGKLHVLQVLLIMRGLGGFCVILGEQITAVYIANSLFDMLGSTNETRPVESIRPCASVLEISSGWQKPRESLNAV